MAAAELVRQTRSKEGPVKIPAMITSATARALAGPHPDFESYTTDEIKTAINDLEDQIKLAREIKDKEAEPWFTQEKRLAIGRARIAQR